MLKLISIFLSLFISLHALADEIANTQSFDLKRTVSFAIENSPSFDSLRKQLDISILEEDTAKARVLPSLDLSATHGILDSTPRQTISKWNSGFDLSLTESLYDNGIALTKSKIASLNKRQAEYNYENQKNKLSLEVVSQFLTYSFNVKLLEIQEKQYKLISKQYGIISKDYYQGIKTKRDFLRFKTQISRGEIDLLNAKSAVEKSKQDLQRVMGINLKSDMQINFIPIAFNDDRLEITNSDSDLNIEDHFQYRAAQLQKDVNKLNADLIGRKNLPEWFVSTGASYTSSNYLGTGQSFSDNAVTSWNALLTVKYNFFDWGIRSRDKEVALQKSLIQANDLDLSLLALKASLKQLQISLRQAQKTFTLSKELLSLEKSNIYFIEREYRNGKAQYLDLITGLSSLSDAEIKFYSAISDLQITRYTLLYHQGKLYEEILK